jgi:hypothetical protein
MKDISSTKRSFCILVAGIIIFLKNRGKGTIFFGEKGISRTKKNCQLSRLSPARRAGKRQTVAGRAIFNISQYSYIFDYFSLPVVVPRPFPWSCLDPSRGRASILPVVAPRPFPWSRLDPSRRHGLTIPVVTA